MKFMDLHHNKHQPICYNTPKPHRLGIGRTVRKASDRSTTGSLSNLCTHHRSNKSSNLSLCIFSLWWDKCNLASFYMHPILKLARKLVQALSYPCTHHRSNTPSNPSLCIFSL